VRHGPSRRRGARGLHPPAPSPLPRSRLAPGQVEITLRKADGSAWTELGALETEADEPMVS
jgi:hypothetical protein